MNARPQRERRHHGGRCHLADGLPEALLAHLRAARERRGDATSPALDAITRESLRSLGYIE